MSRSYLSSIFVLLLTVLLCINNAAADTTMGNVIITTNTTWTEDTYIINNLTVNSGATLSIAGGSTLNVNGAVMVTGNSTLLLQSKNISGLVNGQWAGVGVTISAAIMQIDSGSKISADGQGYSTGSGPGAGAPAIDGYSTSGGSYGGSGGGNSDPVYGSALAPIDLGSGGGTLGGGEIASRGGGAIRLVVSGTLILNGSISANGSTYLLGGYNGGGAGGSIWATIGALTGSGSFTANGSAGSLAHGGGGGRIAVLYTTTSGYTGFTSSSANGTGSGANGSIAFTDVSQANSRLYVYRQYPIAPDTNATYDSITVDNGGTLTIGGGSNIIVKNAITVTGNSTLITQGNNISADSGGAGVLLSAANILVDSGSKISADGQGYSAGSGPGAGAPAIDGYSTSGGSYGGRGGGKSGLTYGSALAPIDLGSGGGTLGGGEIASRGGGAIRLVVSGTLTLNGSISANGSTYLLQGYNGGGAGGSIWATVGTLAGSGSFTANGSAGSSAHGGGGGRIAVYSITNNGFNSNQITANPGGSGYYIGTAGSVTYSNTPQFIWTQPTQYILHDTGKLQWSALSIDMTTTTVDVTAISQGMTYSLGTRLPCISETNWDTTAVPDGSYELRLVFHDGNGVVVGETPKSVRVNNSVIWHTGTVAVDQVWTADKIHVIEGVLTITSGVRVTVNPGAVVKVAKDARIIVAAGGILDAFGTAQGTITFTTIEDDSAGGDTNLDGIQTAPEPGEWLGVTVRGSGQFNQNSFTDIRYIRTVRSGTLSANETWPGTCVYHITTGIVVPNGVTLTIQPGAVIKFDPNLSIDIQSGGSLIANGSVALPIHFTSIKDDMVGGDTNGDNGTSVPAFGDWAFIQVKSGGAAALSNASVRYGGGGGSIIMSEGALTVNNCTVMNSPYDGISTFGGTALISNSVISETDRAINGHGGTVQVINCTIDNNRIGLWGLGSGMTVTNSMVTNNASSGCTSASFIKFSNIWNPLEGSGTGTCSGNGNISADPKYKDLSQKNYRLNYGSPAIDAADGTSALVSDAMGAPRYDDPRTPNTGIATTSGAYADMGAFEFTEMADSNLDLVTGSVSGPTSVIAGNEAHLSWTDTNVGQGLIVGPWHDAIYLVRDPDTNPVEIFAGEVLVGQNRMLSTGQSISPTATIIVPGSIIGNHRWEIRTNSRGEVFEGNNSGNNATLSTGMVAVDLKELSVDGPLHSDQFTSASQSNWYKIIPGPGKDISVRLDLAGNVGTTELYIARGYLPSAQLYDFRHTEWNSANTSTTITNSSIQIYYVMASAGSLSASQASYTLSAKSVNFSVTAVQPGSISNSGNATLNVTGAQFTTGALFGLIGPDGTVYNPVSVYFANSSNAFVTFNMTGLATGNYGVQVTENGMTITDSNVVNVTSGVYNPSQIEYDVIVPQAVRAGGKGTVTVTYRNTSTSDAVAPLMWLDASRFCTLGELERSRKFGPYRIPMYSTGLALGINHDGPAGVIPPGASGSLTFEMKPTVTSGEIFITLNTINQPNALMDWNTMRLSTKPDFVDQSAWNTVFAHMTDSIGSTMGELNRALAADATYLSGLGIYESNPDRLITFELLKAGLGTIVPRYTMGAFGLGASHAFDIWGESKDGNIILHYPVGKIRIMLPDTTIAHQFNGSTGDYGALVVNSLDNSWLLTEQNGVSYHFKLDPNNGINHVIDYINDLNGNRLTINYSGSLVTSVTSSSGDSLQFSYNANNTVHQVTDPVGRISTFTYDVTGGQLTAVTDATGTTSMSYVPYNGSNPALFNAVQVITYPDGTHLNFEYDTIGRMTKQYYDGGEETFNYAYDSNGVVTVTDALGNSSRIMPTDVGQIGQITDPLGALTQFSYNKDQHLVRTTAPLSTTYAFGYDEFGNRNAVTDPAGNQQSFKYGAYGSLLSLTGGLGTTLHYAYDYNYNNNEVTFQDSSAKQATYDSRGNLVALTNRRGSQVTYTFDSQNLLTRKTYKDGTHIDYDYDSHRNLQSLTGSAGTTSFTYDGADRLTGVSYPNGRFLQYVYDSKGRMSSMSDQSGFTVTYGYDAVGRLSLLADGSSNTITAYAYDTAGNLIRKTMGNGTYTTYSYDPGGNILQMVNHAANNAINSSYTYTYDLLGRKTSMTGPDGLYSYGYDASGQLISVTLPGGGSVSYTYDAAGNRTSTVAAGITTDYSVNGLNEYTLVGGTNFTYDADGNLASRSGISGAWNYTYDDENRLVSMSGPGNTWTYEYDSLGMRVAQTHNGQRTEYLIDPTGMGNIVAEYGNTGTLRAHYTYGLDLASMVPAGNSILYYHFDGSGNTTQLTGASGTIMNSYGYLPFGEKVSSTETVTNNFTFVGQFGVRDEGNNLYFMRHRWYDPAIGRFIATDPLGIDGDDINLYSYASNQPTGLIDPMGLNPGTEYLAKKIPGAGDALEFNEDARMLLDNKKAVQEHNTKVLDLANPNGTKKDYGTGHTWGGAEVQKTLNDAGKIVSKWASKLYPGENVAKTWDFISNAPKKIKNLPTFKQLPKQINNVIDNHISDGIANYYIYKGKILPYIPSIWSPQKKKPVKIPSSSDPNLKTTVGYGTQGYITGDTPISYMVEFENMASATAPAQKVVVTDQLSTNLDWSTFQLSQITLNNTTIFIPAGLQSYTAQMTVPTDSNPVNVSIALNPATGLVSATMESVDPVTGDVPEDPYAGFLPPNDSTHRGEGFISFTIKPKAGITDGTIINNASTIVFDVNAPITTNTVINTIDSIRPTSAVNVTASNTVTDSFTVSWGGNDKSGSGMAYYNVYVSTDGGLAAVWLAANSLTSALFSGLAGHEYSFYTLAVDNAGNHQITPAAAQQVITSGLPLAQVDTSPTLYRSIVSALGSAGNNSKIKLRNTGFSESLLFASPFTVTLLGGYNSGFNSVVGYSTVLGTVTINSGTVIIHNLVIN